MIYVGVTNKVAIYKEVQFFSWTNDVLLDIYY